MLTRLFWRDVAVHLLFSNFLCDWPSVDHWLVNRAVRPERSLHLLSNVHFCGVVDNKNGWTSQTAEFVDNRFTPWYNRFICFLLQVPQTSNSSATTTLCSFINKTSICHLKFFHYSVVLIGCRPVMSSFSDDPLSQFTAKPFLRCKQAREPTYRCQQLKANIYIYNNILKCQPPITYI